MKKLPSLAEYFVKNAPEYGASVLLESEYQYAGMIEFSNGNRRFFKYNHIDINTVGSSEIVKDKAYSQFFLKKLGYRSIAGETFYSDEWARDIGSQRTSKKVAEYIAKIGLPVFIKPNNSGMGYGVAKINSEAQISEAINQAMQYDKIILVQKALEDMIDVRFVIFAGEVICVYSKKPLSVTGDGEHTIEELFVQKKEVFQTLGRSLSVNINDYRIKNILGNLNIDNTFIPKKGKEIELLSNANLSQGAEGFDLTDTISNEWKKWAIELSQKMNLTLCGIDVLIKDMNIGPAGDNYAMLEINGSPGLSHYKTLSPMALERTEDLYKKILDYMAHGK